MKLTLYFIGLLAFASLRIFAQQPNVLFILADDHNKKTINCYADELKGYCETPEIDKLAKEGMRLNKMIATNALCAPSRATILTGMYSHKNGVYTLREKLNTKILPTLPKIFKKQGYQTAVYGKWHLNGDNLYGFDDYAITLAQGKYFNPVFKTPKGKLKTKGYSTDIISKMGSKWLKKRNKNKPFMLFIHYKAAHGPWQFAKRHEKLFDDIKIPEPKTIHDKFLNRTGSGSMQFKMNSTGKKSLSKKLEATYTNQESKDKDVYQKYIKAYLRCVKGIDEGVGQLLKTLEAENLMENTIVVYTSDQGMFVGEHGFYDKRLGLNEAIEMPFIVRYPKNIEGNTQSDILANNTDIAPTLLDMCNIKIPQSFQGISFKQVLTGQKSKGKRQQSFYGFYSNGVWKHYGLVTEKYKLLHYLDKKGKVAAHEMYNLKNDSAEIKNIYLNDQYRKVREEMNQKLIMEMKDIGLKKENLPGKNKKAP